MRTTKVNSSIPIEIENFHPPSFIKCKILNQQMSLPFDAISKESLKLLLENYCLTVLKEAGYILASLNLSFIKEVTDEDKPDIEIEDVTDELKKICFPKKVEDFSINELNFLLDILKNASLYFDQTDYLENSKKVFFLMGKIDDIVEGKKKNENNDRR